MKADDSQFRDAGLFTRLALVAAAVPRMALPNIQARVDGLRVPRNGPCPCGSGKKFKRCHGNTGKFLVVKFHQKKKGR